MNEKFFVFLFIKNESNVMGENPLVLAYVYNSHGKNLKLFCHTIKVFYCKTLIFFQTFL